MNIQRMIASNMIKRLRMYKIVIGIIICGLLLLNNSLVFAEDFFDGKVDKVLDGGTIILRGGTIVQYMGIDVPKLRGGNPSFSDIAEVAFNSGFSDQGNR